MKKAIVTARIASMYAQGNALAERVDEALCGMVVEVLEEGAAFCRIRTPYGYEGYTGIHDIWVDEKQIALWQDIKRSVIRHASVDILAAPKVQAVRLQRLTTGCAVVCLKAEDDGWTQVMLADGREGFLRTAHVGRPIPKRLHEDEDAFRHAVLETALSYMGAQYRWGGKTPEGVDCSGLCSMAYLLNGVTICRDARIDEAFPVRGIASEAAKPGDLLYFPGHIAMSIGGGRFVHATAAGDGVCINSLDANSGDARMDLAGTIITAGSIF